MTISVQLGLSALGLVCLLLVGLVPVTAAGCYNCAAAAECREDHVRLEPGSPCPPGTYCYTLEVCGDTAYCACAGPDCTPCETDDECGESQSCVPAQEPRPDIGSQGIPAHCESADRLPT